MMIENYENELITKVNEYERYIIEHQEFVKKIWIEIRRICNGDFWINEYDYSNINILIENHDKSKFDEKEFMPYRKKFYPTKEENYKENIKHINKNFLYAWNAHQKSNPHHWEYWIDVSMKNGNLNITALDMEFKYIIEMLCDWSAMSLKFGDLPSEFYNKRKEDMILHEKTRECIENWIKKFDNCVSNIRKIL